MQKPAIISDKWGLNMYDLQELSELDMKIILRRFVLTSVDNIS